MEAARRGRPLGAGRFDQAKIDVVSEADVRRHLLEDGFDPENPLKGLRPVLPIAALRRRTGLSQDAFAKALGLPAATLRNWEQGRKRPDPAARALLALVADDPERALRVLSKVVEG